MSNSMADKLKHIAVNAQLIYNVGYENGRSESVPVELPHSYFISEHYVCFWGMADNCIGKPITELIDLAGLLNVYGYALPSSLKGKQIKLTGFDWGKAYLGDMRENIVFVKGFTSEGGGVCVFPHSQIKIAEVINLPIVFCKTSLRLRLFSLIFMPHKTANTANNSTTTANAIPNQKSLPV